jgi:anti-sigma factor RsiW
MDDMSDTIELFEHPTDWLPEYARGQVPDADEIERHLAACPRCREELELLRALAGAVPETMSEAERELVYSRIRERRRVSGSWLAGAWKVAAAIALVLSGVGIWQIVVAGEASGEWNPAMAMSGWEEEIEDLGVEDGDVLLALAYTPDRREVMWEDLTGLEPEELENLDPDQLVGPWEEEK